MAAAGMSSGAKYKNGLHHLLWFCESVSAEGSG